jgi:hypothetical protein
VQKTLKALKWSQMDPVVCCVQSTKTESELKRDFSALAQYPMIRIPCTDSSSIMTGLEWWSVVTKRMIQHYLNSYTTLSVSYTRK